MNYQLGLAVSCAIAVMVSASTTQLFGQAQPGRLAGRVKLTTASSQRSTSAAYDRRSVSPRAKPLPESRNVVIYFESMAALRDVAAMQASIAQKDEQFVPHVVAVTTGDMSAVIRVFDHPWFTIPDEQGGFVIADVPAGEHTVVAWHERIGERRDRITIRAGQTTDVSFTLPVLEAAK